MTTTRDRSPQQGPERSRVARFADQASTWAAGQPLLDYTMIRTIIIVLAGLGVVMVMSSSMTWSVLDEETVWAQPLKQAIMVGLGLIGFWFALRLSPERVRKWSLAIMVIAVALLVIVLTPLGTGRESVGSQSWIALPGFQLQPSEFAKVAIAIWGGSVLADKEPGGKWTWKNGFLPFTLVSVLCFLLIAAQGDFGMAVSFAVVVGFALIFAGVSWKVVGFVAIAGLVLLGIVMVSGGFRSNRFHTFFDALTGEVQDTQGTGYQTYQGFLSLADGSLFGVGLGQSRAKWFYLPEAKNDFIFAVIGEELGLWGGALVILLFFALAFFGFRTARRAQNQFQALMAGTLTAGVVSQAFINIGYVVGLLPVTGIQLPMISAGGTSAVITLASMGLLASVARHEPDAVSSIRNHGRPLFDRVLLLPEPRPPARRVRDNQAGDAVADHGIKDAPEAESHRGNHRGGAYGRYGAPVTARNQARRPTEDRKGTSTAVQRPRRAPMQSRPRRQSGDYRR